MLLYMSTKFGSPMRTQFEPGTHSVWISKAEHVEVRAALLLLIKTARMRCYFFLIVCRSFFEVRATSKKRDLSIT